MIFSKLRRAWEAGSCVAREDFAEDYRASMVCLGLRSAAADIYLPLCWLLVPQISAEARVCALSTVTPVETIYTVSYRLVRSTQHCFCMQTRPLKTWVDSLAWKSLSPPLLAHGCGVTPFCVQPWGKHVALPGPRPSQHG